MTTTKEMKDALSDRGYKENDILGGEDPYSASKAAAEIVFYSYLKYSIKDTGLTDEIQLAFI